VILICRVGNRSSVIANMLVEQAGYSKVYNVTDGITRWIKDGNPVSR
jgi:rhodanese-related sulfurtransferase